MKSQHQTLSRFNIGDIVDTSDKKGKFNKYKRVIFCKRLKCLALQNPMAKQTDLIFDNTFWQGSAGYMAETFRPQSRLILTKTGFQSIAGIKNRKKSVVFN